MTHDEIMHALAAIFFAYANPVVNYRPQKDDPHCIWITAGGNLINYNCNAFVCTADLDTAKLHWNSVVSTANARYMCLDIKKVVPHRGTEILWIHEDPPGIISGMDN